MRHRGRRRSGPRSSRRHVSRRVKSAVGRRGSVTFHGASSLPRGTQATGWAHGRRRRPCRLSSSRCVKVPVCIIWASLSAKMHHGSSSCHRFGPFGGNGATSNGHAEKSQSLKELKGAQVVIARSEYCADTVLLLISCCCDMQPRLKHRPAKQDR